MTRAVLLALSLYFPVALSAEMPAASQEEINHLLDYVGKSGCQFYRNGTWHGSKQGRSHLDSKYAYLAARGSVHSAEQFIEKVATASSLSGETYQVKCDGQAQVPSARWLSDELGRYRADTSRSPSNPGGY